MIMCITVMIKNSVRQYLYFLALVFSIWPAAHASVARMDIALGSQTPTPVYIELFDTRAPITVANFLNYIENANGDRRYDGTFIHRSIANFIVQGGGLVYDPALGAFSTSTTPNIPTDPPIVNEFDPTDPTRSNLRGTIAMAKVGNKPDSAKSDWFFNLADNSANLDSQNGGFTVFGKVLGSGMTTIGSIVALGTENLGRPLDTLPLYNHTLGTPVLAQNLVTITMASSPYAPPLFVSPATLDFVPAIIGAKPVQQVVTLLNVGDTNLTFGKVAKLDGLSTPFAIVSDNCSNLPHTSFSTCTLTLEFTPTTAGAIKDTFDIPSDAVNQPTVTFNVSGTGVPSKADIVIPRPATVDFGDTEFDIPVTRNIPITNQGAEDLFIASVNITGTEASEFSVTNTCQRISPAARTCSEVLTFTPSGTGSKSAILEITSNDPDTPVLSLPVMATSSSDNDGVPDQIEAAGPNNGDGNGDGTPDLQQQNVTSLPDINGAYVTLETGAGLSLASVTTGTNPSPGNTPTPQGGATLDFRNGFFSFIVTGMPPGGGATVTLTLPKDQAPSTYFKFGWFPTENPSRVPPHWYQFDFDQQSGIGAEIQGNQVVLYLVDGGFGDNDLARDGRIVDPGGPATATLASSSGGGGGGCVLNDGNGRKQPSISLLLILAGLLTKRFLKHQYV